MKANSKDPNLAQIERNKVELEKEKLIYQKREDQRKVKRGILIENEMISDIEDQREGEMNNDDPVRKI